MVKLLLVESPSKCDIIRKYLGSDYTVLATYGHFRNISTLKDISVTETDINIKYTVADSKKTHNILNTIRKEISSTDEVILATDDDREGEAIAWHVCNYFSLPIETTRRIIFHEITQDSIRSAVNMIQYIDMNKVHAQMARQLLDIFIGFKISPLLWKYISNKNEKYCLSAGRCQTPALKLIQDNHEKIQIKEMQKDHTPHYEVVGYFTHLHIPFKLNGLLTNEEIPDFLEQSKNHLHIYSVSPISTCVIQPPLPFNTSRLIQASYNAHQLSPNITMKLCQKLYEGGFITYMRTDNSKYSQYFVNSVAKYIKDISNTPAIYPDMKRIVEHNRSAHEAIRPTNIFTSDISHKVDKLTSNLYKLIWTNSISSCLEPALMEVLKVSLNAPFGKQYEYSSQRPIREGWTKYSSSKKTTDNNSIYNYLLKLSPGTSLKYNHIYTPYYIEPREGRYTESALVRILETEGIGRPSTYAGILDKLQSKNYVSRISIPGIEYPVTEYKLLDDVVTTIHDVKTIGSEKNKLVIQNTGIAVSQFLYTYFEPLFNIGYTRQTEEELDAITLGQLDWKSVCFKNYTYICNMVKEVTTNNVERFGIIIDDMHTYIIGKYGPVIKRISLEGEVSFLPVNPNIDISAVQNSSYTLKDILAPEKDKKVETNAGLFGCYDGKDIIVKTGRYGRFIVYGDLTKSIKCFGTRDITNITMEEMIKVITTPKRTNVWRKGKRSPPQKKI
jgi:DNA topoisomerase-1